MAQIGERIIYTNEVQGVKYWRVEISINSGEYSELTEIDPESGESYSDVGSGIYYICPREITGSGDDEKLIYSFAFGYTIPEAMNIGDTFVLKFTPDGFSTGMGEAIESDEYTVTETVASTCSTDYQMLAVFI